MPSQLKNLYTTPIGKTALVSVSCFIAGYLTCMCLTKKPSLEEQLRSVLTYHPQQVTQTIEYILDNSKK